MSELKNPNNSNQLPSSSSSSSSTPVGTRFPNPPDPVNPDPATLKEQWRFAIRQYSRWYSHAWGTAILAGVSFFALGWLIKGSNPLPSLSSGEPHKRSSDSKPNNKEESS